MLKARTRMLGALLCAVSLAACVPTTSTAPATAAASAPASTLDSTVYVSRQDGTFTLPAIPLERLPEQYRRQTVDYPTNEAPGTIIINTAEKHLYFVTGPNKAIRYGIAVGRSGFDWSGTANIAGRKEWPTWTPPPEMIDRRPELAKWASGQPGGPENPLGARALYLKTNGVDYGYRIHGTPEWESIGHNASSGCIRMINQDIIDLYGRAPDGAKVIVMTKDGKMPTKLTVPPKPVKAKTVTTPEPRPDAAPDVAPVPADPYANPVVGPI